jgi:hypothetical protein
VSRHPQQDREMSAQNRAPHGLVRWIIGSGSGRLPFPRHELGPERAYARERVRRSCGVTSAAGSASPAIREGTTPTQARLFGRPERRHIGERQTTVVFETSAGSLAKPQPRTEQLHTRQRQPTA